jgi:hypothetical protein
MERIHSDDAVLIALHPSFLLESSIPGFRASLSLPVNLPAASLRV